MSDVLLARHARRTLVCAAMVSVLVAGVGGAHGADASSPYGLCGKAARCGGVPVAAMRRGKRPLCVRYRCRTFATNTAGAELLFVAERHAPRYSLQAVVGTFARWRPTGRLTLLVAKEVYEFGPLGYGPPKPIALNGHYVAFAEPDCTEVSPCTSSQSPGPGPELVVRVDIKTGHRVKTGDRGEVTDLVATRKGAVAWIEHHYHEVSYEVRTARTSAEFASPRLLVSSPSIDPHSLVAVRGHIHWTEGSQPREAQIG